MIMESNRKMKPAEQICFDMGYQKAISIFGATADHLRDLLAAEKDGRCVVLPCKVGDTVYRISQKEKVGSVGVDDEGIYVMTNFAVYREEHFGRFIFFTHEAAETEKGESHD